MFIGVSLYLKAQKSPSVLRFDSTSFVHKTDSLRHFFGSNKFIPEELELCCLIALSYYPELKNTSIVFKKAAIKTTLNARPKLTSILFCSKTKRTYIIRINNRKSKGTILISDADFNSKIGLLGHEFAHVEDYSNRRFFGVISRGISYTNKRSKQKFEHQTDLETIHRGLGHQLYDWAYFVLYISKASEEYKEFKREIYLTPEQISTEMKRIGY
jgi:hypothetical protein